VATHRRAGTEVVVIDLSAAWPALVRAVEAERGEVAGWITGDDQVLIVERGDHDRMMWPDVALLALVAAVQRGQIPRVMFHSHPDGRAALSIADRAAWAPTGTPLHGTPQLVVATRRGRAVAATLFAWPTHAVEPSAIARYYRDDRAWTVSS
jgi:proteasome lid subunit RPN8/RPN11